MPDRCPRPQWQGVGWLMPRAANSVVLLHRDHWLLDRVVQLPARDLARPLDDPPNSGHHQI
jgi:hypothetical protein